jgi:hypothetical protein
VEAKQLLVLLRLVVRQVEYMMAVVLVVKEVVVI